MRRPWRGREILTIFTGEERQTNMVKFCTYSVDSLTQGALRFPPDSARPLEMKHANIRSQNKKQKSSLI